MHSFHIRGVSLVTDIIKILFMKMEWDVFRILNHISDEEGILVLSGENAKIDEISVARFGEYLKKKYLSKGVILVNRFERNMINHIKKNTALHIRIISLSPIRLKHFYKLHCVKPFVGNIAFTYINTPKDNKLGKYLEKSELDENELVCLALFRLGHV